jgi:cytoskeletal protein CcmA (bactofilin family)
MKNPFKRTGFDSVIAAGNIVGQNILIASGQSFVIDGTFDGGEIQCVEDAKNTTLFIGGEVQARVVNVHNVTITGKLTCGTLVVHGDLAVKNGAKVVAEVIRYRSLVVEPKAVITGVMEHLDSKTGEPDVTN